MKDLHHLQSALINILFTAVSLGEVDAGNPLQRAAAARSHAV